MKMILLFITILLLVYLTVLLSIPATEASPQEKYIGCRQALNTGISAQATPTAILASLQQMVMAMCG